jgi:hypothetical protein
MSAQQIEGTTVPTPVEQTPAQARVARVIQALATGTQDRQKVIDGLPKYKEIMDRLTVATTAHAGATAAQDKATTAQAIATAQGELDAYLASGTYSPSQIARIRKESEKGSIWNVIKSEMSTQLLTSKLPAYISGAEEMTDDIADKIVALYGDLTNRKPRSSKVDLKAMIDTLYKDWTHQADTAFLPLDMYPYAIDLIESIEDQINADYGETVRASNPISKDTLVKNGLQVIGKGRDARAIPQGWIEPAPETK